MTITKVSYQKTYPTAPYENEKIGMEATIDEDYETVSESIEKLKKHCDEIHKTNNPQLYQEQGQYYYTPKSIKEETGIERVYSSTGNPFPEKTPEQAAQELIETATQSNIKWFKNLPEKYPQLKELYQQKLKELTN